VVRAGWRLQFGAAGGSVDRRKLLDLIDVGAGRGLEIGALMEPVVTKAMGRVEYIDRASTGELRHWYANQGHVDPAGLVEVDHVWGSQTLLDCVGGVRRYDYVIASHVLEHVPDLFGWLCEVASVLVDGGIASFAIPDKRYTFDALRRTSSGSELVDAYVRRLRKPDVRQIFDHFTSYRDIDTAALHDGRITPQALPPVHDPRGILEACQRAAENGDYVDTHCWVFTPLSFVDAVDLGNRLHLLPFEIAALFPTAERSHEFFVSLRRLPESMSIEERRAAFLASRQRLDLPPEHPELAQDALVRRTAAAEQALRTAEERLSAAEGQLSELLNSTSWRITAPLRRLVSAWRSRGNPR
jgi:hypothetical protein